MKNDKLFFIYVCKEYALCTTELTDSENTIDINFADFAADEKLLNILSLCTILIKPMYHLLTDPMQGEKLIDHTAFYIASLGLKINYEQSVAYMKNNGIIRILPMDTKVKKDLVEWNSKRTQKVIVYTTE